MELRWLAISILLGFLHLGAMTDQERFLNQSSYERRREWESSLYLDSLGRKHEENLVKWAQEKREQRAASIQNKFMRGAAAFMLSMGCFCASQVPLEPPETIVSQNMLRLFAAAGALTGCCCCSAGCCEWCSDSCKTEKRNS